MKSLSLNQLQEKELLPQAYSFLQSEAEQHGEGAMVVYRNGDTVIDDVYRKSTGRLFKVISYIEKEYKIKCNLFCAKSLDINTEIMRLEGLAANDSYIEHDEKIKGAKTDFTQMVTKGIEIGASDIHIRISPTNTTILYRVDGFIEDTMFRRDYNDTKRMIAAAINFMGVERSSDNFDENIAVKSGLDLIVLLGKKRVKVECRINYSPLASKSGKCVIRLLKQDGEIKNLEQLFIKKQTCMTFKRVLEQPNGLILISGPTGAGKSTTLHAMIKDKPSRKLVATIEDPIEIKSKDPKVYQTPFDESLGYEGHIANLLREDPDIGVVGEIRNKNTAKATIELCRTGHLVLSTLHTNDAIQNVSRLADLGVDVTDLADPEVLRLLIAQRLIPMNCPHCTKLIKNTAQSARWTELENMADDLVLEKLRLLSLSGKLKQGVGCEKCRFKGYLGRRNVMEHIVVDAYSRTFIRNKDFDGWRDALKKKGWQSLQDETWEGIEKGIFNPLIANSFVHNLLIDTNTAWRYGNVS